MQLLTKGQWWSYRSTHWSQSGQWELRGGRMILQVRHHLYPLTVPGCIMHHCCPWTHHIYLRNQTRRGKQILLWKTSMFPSRCKYHISYISYIHKSPFRPLWASGFFRSSSDTILEASSDLRSTPQDQSNRCKDNLSSTKQCLVHRWVTTSACPVGCPFPSTS